MLEVRTMVLIFFLAAICPSGLRCRYSLAGTHRHSPLSFGKGINELMLLHRVISMMGLRVSSIPLPLEDRPNEWYWIERGFRRSAARQVLVLVRPVAPFVKTFYHLLGCSEKSGGLHSRISPLSICRFGCELKLTLVAHHREHWVSYWRLNKACDKTN